MKSALTFAEAMDLAIFHRKRVFREGKPTRKIVYYVSPPELFFPGEESTVTMRPFLVEVLGVNALPYSPSFDDMMACDWCSP